MNKFVILLVSFKIVTKDDFLKRLKYNADDNLKVLIFDFARGHTVQYYLIIVRQLLTVYGKFGHVTIRRTWKEHTIALRRLALYC
ncbi:hypothetical protein VNO77_01640 [Canavalia gladiata]|uniref:Uncharacterized protein n=1 Tax=Canavalia gladiata TaxID=3824 RepID=A0AAN9MY16_CANGL